MRIFSFYYFHTEVTKIVYKLPLLAITIPFSVSMSFITPSTELHVSGITYYFSFVTNLFHIMSSRLEYYSASLDQIFGNCDKSIKAIKTLDNFSGNSLLNVVGTPEATGSKSV